MEVNVTEDEHYAGLDKRFLALDPMDDNEELLSLCREVYGIPVFNDSRIEKTRKWLLFGPKLNEYVISARDYRINVLGCVAAVNCQAYCDMMPENPYLDHSGTWRWHDTTRKFTVPRSFQERIAEMFETFERLRGGDHRKKLIDMEEADVMALWRHNLVPHRMRITSGLIGRIFGDWYKCYIVDTGQYYLKLSGDWVHMSRNHAEYNDRYSRDWVQDENVGMRVSIALREQIIGLFDK
jgi:hypothetical protein